MYWLCRRCWCYLTQSQARSHRITPYNHDPYIELPKYVSNFEEFLAIALSEGKTRVTESGSKEFLVPWLFTMEHSEELITAKESLGINTSVKFNPNISELNLLKHAKNQYRLASSQFMKLNDQNHFDNTDE
jgi:hypothetical protein